MNSASRNKLGINFYEAINFFIFLRWSIKIWLQSCFLFFLTFLTFHLAYYSSKSKEWSLLLRVPVPYAFYVPLRLYLPNVIPLGPLHILHALGTLIHPLLIGTYCILLGITWCFDWLHSSLSTVGWNWIPYIPRFQHCFHVMKMWNNFL